MGAPFPRYSLCNTLWDFHGKVTYGSQVAFEKAVYQYHLEGQEYAPDVRPGDCWQPARLAVRFPRVMVRYYSDPPGEVGGWNAVELTSDDGESFTVGELLYKLHNAVVEHLRDSGHRWFEGLELETVNKSGAPVYCLRLGS